MTFIDRLLLEIAPAFAISRIRARAAVRQFEAAAPTRRTSGWARSSGDVNSVIARAGNELRIHSRRLLENNGWAKRGRNVVVNNTVGWGLMPRSTTPDPAVAAIWKRWSESTECDADGRKTFAGIQAAVMRALVSDGEVLVRRRPRRLKDGYVLPVQIQVIEADHLDRAKNEARGIEGGPIKQGVELDALGRRVAFWLFDTHPGDTATPSAVSRRIPADQVAHIFSEDRPGQLRGVPWLTAGIVDLSELGEFDDAEVMRAKIAACFAAFVTDTDGTATPLGNLETEANGERVEAFEPGMIVHLPPGKEVTTASPPQLTGDALSTRLLRKVAAGLGVTYEDLTGDYSQVNFSSARMGRIVHQAMVRSWQNEILIPQLCDVVWGWVMDSAETVGEIAPTDVLPTAEWTAPPLPMIEPDKEGLAYTRLIRSGLMTPSDAIREQGADPETHWAKYAADMSTLDRLGIKLDSDVRAVSQAGLTQERTGLAGKAEPDPAQK